MGTAVYFYFSRFASKFIFFIVFTLISVAPSTLFAGYDLKEKAVLGGEKSSDTRQVSTKAKREAFLQNVDAALASKRRFSRASQREIHLLVTTQKPLTPDVAKYWRENELTLVNKIGSHRWIVATSAMGARFIDREGMNAILLTKEHKISHDARKTAPWRIRNGDRLSFSVRFHRDVLLEEVLALESARLKVEFEEFDRENFDILHTSTVVAPVESLNELADLDIVEWIESPGPPNEAVNSGAQSLSEVDVIHSPPYSISGNGVRVGVFEPGQALVAHMGFNGGAILSGQWPSPPIGPGVTSHATHVAGTVGARHPSFPTQEGMAPSSIVVSSWNGHGDNSQEDWSLALSGLSQPDNIEISTHSYGGSWGWKCRNSTALCTFRPQENFGVYANGNRQWDDLIFQENLKTFVAAGNDRNNQPGTGHTCDSTVNAQALADCNSAILAPIKDCLQNNLGVDANCLMSNSLSKNVITIGSVRTNAAANAVLNIAASSSFGPTTDGRIKPDLVTKGRGVNSLDAVEASPLISPTDVLVNGSWYSSTATDIKGGTSMATPVAAGVGALVLSDAPFHDISVDAATLKSLLIHGADDVAGIGQAQVGPDFATGWGLINARASIDLLRAPGTGTVIQSEFVINDVGPVFERSFYVASSTPQIKATLVWADGPAVSPIGTTASVFPASLDPSPLMNDLDLRLFSPDGTEFKPWRLDATQPGDPAVIDGGDDVVNNVEQVVVLAPISGVWTVRVSAKPSSLMFGNQPFTIVGPFSWDLVNSDDFPEIESKPFVENLSPPLVELYVVNGENQPKFRSTDSPRSGADVCTKTTEPTVEMRVQALDEQGPSSINVHIFDGSIDQASIEIHPANTVISYLVSTMRDREILTISVPEIETDRHIDGVAATFRVNPHGDSGVQFWANSVDNSGEWAALHEMPLPTYYASLPSANMQCSAASQ